MLVHLIILNYNGRRLLPECLPSILHACEASRHECEVVIIDNSSTDESLSWLSENYPQVRVIHCANHGLCSYNAVVPSLGGDVAILLNNDIKLHANAVDPLVDPFLENNTKCFMTTPRCRRFDNATYEGFRTAVSWRWGLVQATALYPGHEAMVGIPGWTASAGAAMAVDSRKFVELGGFDPLYLPGRLEDLDFAFRAYRAGYHACYVPHALCWHKGMATFEAAFGTHGCDELALRNTLLFQWKNLRHPANIARQIFGAALRSLADLIRAPWMPRLHRWRFVRALAAAWKRKKEIADQFHGWSGMEPHFIAVRRERDYFRRFHPNYEESFADEPMVDRLQLQMITEVDTWS
ncbi:MAG: glycosyltransferase [Pirellulales bacterium]|nr:glycosyltransferase [Pirellulales bacterium]